MARQSHKWINLSDGILQIDPDVQGVRRERRVQEMADNWDPTAAGTITLSLRQDGSLFVIDGQHRVAAALLTKDRPEREVAGHILAATTKVTRMYALVYEGLSKQDEARMYILLNNTKIPMAIDRVAVAAVAGEEAPERLVQIAEKYGWYLKKAPKIQSPIALLKVAQMDDDGLVLDRVFNVLTKAWSHEPDSTRSSIVEGLAKLIKERPHADDERLVRVLAKSKPSTILANIESLRGTYAARARVVAIAGLYDRGLSDARKLGL